VLRGRLVTGQHARARERAASAAQYVLLGGFAAVAAGISAQGLTGFARTALAACDRPARPGGLAARRVRRPSAGLGARWPGPDSPIRPSPPRSCVMSRC